ncbi:MAG: GlsB/YeaQ/YmgE family stress response membrane protein [Cytophagales bacterium]|nr:MAG: GlsB/YeaQ/YmgE family stress response membrane protein [Cytophagales bacterium]
MGILYSIIIGGIAGFLASRFMGSSNSMLTNIILGIVGGFVGNFIADKLGNDRSNDNIIVKLLIAVAGAALLIFVGRFF